MAITYLTLQIETDAQFNNVPIYTTEFPYSVRHETMTLKEIVNIIETSEDDDQVEQAKKFLIEKVCRLNQEELEWKGFPIDTLVGVRAET